MKKLPLLTLLLPYAAAKTPTVNASECSLVFKYQGVYYTGCTDADSERMPWCLLKKPMNGKVWGYCNVKTINTYVAEDQGARRDCELSTPVRGGSSVFGCYSIDGQKTYNCLSGGKELRCVMDNNDFRRPPEKHPQPNKPSKGTLEAQPPSDEDATSLPLIVVLSILGGLLLALASVIFLFYRARAQASHPLAKAYTPQKHTKAETAFSGLVDIVPPKASYTVVSTYVPSLSDELLIHPGDKVVIYKEYDDGWVQGANLTRAGARGVFPKHCLLPREPNTPNPYSKRSSSNDSFAPGRRI